MQQKHAKKSKIHTFQVGEYASLRIPRIDRASTDLQRLPCVVVQVIGKAQSMYRLRCKHGVLRTCFHAGDMEPFSGTYQIPVDGWEDQPKVTLREAARQQSPWNSFTKNRCNCKPGTCDTQRCHCKKTGIKCSTHCHKGEDCNNKVGKHEACRESKKTNLKKENSHNKMCDKVNKISLTGRSTKPEGNFTYMYM